MTKIKIYCWDNSPGDHDWHTGLAMAEDGTVIASHMSSSHGWSRHDMAEMHRPDYVAKYGENGFETIWLEEPKTDAGWVAATEFNRKQGEAAARASIPTPEQKAAELKERAAKLLAEAEAELKKVGKGR